MLSSICKPSSKNVIVLERSTAFESLPIASIPRKLVSQCQLNERLEHPCPFSPGEPGRWENGPTHSPCQQLITNENKQGKPSLSFWTWRSFPWDIFGAQKPTEASRLSTLKSTQWFAQRLCQQAGLLFVWERTKSTFEASSHLLQGEFLFV